MMGMGGGGGSGGGRQSLIVVASFVEKAPNLGGLCRTCEVFGAEMLCVHSLSIADDPIFKALSVTANKWLPITELPQASVISGLKRWKKLGYTIVGLEQTSSSVSICDYVFPEKTVVLLCPSLLHLRIRKLFLKQLLWLVIGSY